MGRRRVHSEVNSAKSTEYASHITSPRSVLSVSHVMSSEAKREQQRLGESAIEHGNSIIMTPALIQSEKGLSGFCLYTRSQLVDSDTGYTVLLVDVELHAHARTHARTHAHTHTHTHAHTHAHTQRLSENNTYIRTVQNFTRYLTLSQPCTSYQPTEGNEIHQIKSRN